MTFSAPHSTVQICLQGVTTDISTMPGSATESRHHGSALQNPEMRRLELVAMLRRSLKKQLSRKSQQTYWAAFMSDYIHKNANSNDS